MRHLIAVGTVLLSLAGAGAHAQAPTTLFDIPIAPMTSADGRTSATTLKPYQGKVLLIVNVASKCGFTKQYEQLETIRQKYKNQGFEVLGFPSNQFGGQEPGTEAEIVEFCKARFSVTFPLFAKVDVKGNDIAPLFKYLTQGDHPAAQAIAWNFNKFLVGRDGRPIAHFGSMVRPDSRAMIDAIEAALAAK